MIKVSRKHEDEDVEEVDNNEEDDDEDEDDNDEDEDDEEVSLQQMCGVKVGCKSGGGELQGG